MLGFRHSIYLKQQMSKRLLQNNQQSAETRANSNRPAQEIQNRRNREVNPRGSSVSRIKAWFKEWVCSPSFSSMSSPESPVEIEMVTRLKPALKRSTGLPQEGHQHQISDPETDLEPGTELEKAPKASAKSVRFIEPVVPVPISDKKKLNMNWKAFNDMKLATQELEGQMLQISKAARQLPASETRKMLDKTFSNLSRNRIHERMSKAHQEIGLLMTGGFDYSKRKERGIPGPDAFLIKKLGETTSKLRELDGTFQEIQAQFDQVQSDQEIQSQSDQIQFDQEIQSQSDQIQFDQEIQSQSDLLKVITEALVTARQSINAYDEACPQLLIEQTK